jgi:hypothetical protein
MIAYTGAREARAYTAACTYTQAAVCYYTSACTYTQATLRLQCAPAPTPAWPLRRECRLYSAPYSALYNGAVLAHGGRPCANSRPAMR